MSDESERAGRLWSLAYMLLKRLRKVYRYNGPRGKRGRVVPAAAYAALSRKQIDRVWDFATRHEMHTTAKLIVAAEADLKLLRQGRRR